MISSVIFQDVNMGGLGKIKEVGCPGWCHSVD